MSASAVLWPTDTLYDVQGLCCFNAQTCSGFSLHSPNLESSTQSAATCSNPVITGPSVPCKNHNWNHLSICFLFSSPKLLHGQCDICKCNSGAPTEASFFFLNKCWQFGSHHICLVPWATESWGCCQEWLHSIHPSCIHKKSTRSCSMLWKCHSTASTIATILHLHFTFC